MNTKTRSLKISDIQVEIVRKDIKNLHLAVYPPYGRVRVAAPELLNDEAIRLAVITRLAWIKRQQAVYTNQVRQSEREMVTGESHYVGGRRYLLDVIEEEAPPSVRIRNNRTLELKVRPGTGRDKREKILNDWYRKLLREQLADLVPKWKARTGVEVAEYRIKKMKTRWGTCNIQARRIWLNLELAKKSSACLEYILVHEMIHLLERHHNDQFWKYLNRFLPQWQLTRDELNRSPLGHEDWRY